MELHDVPNSTNKKTGRKINSVSKLATSTTLRINSQALLCGKCHLLLDNETFYNRSLNYRKMSSGLWLRKLNY